MLFRSANESLSNDEMIDEKYQGIRPAPGYPACPEHSVKLGMSEVFANFKNKLNIKIMYFLTGLSIAISIIVASVPWFRWDKHEHENWLIFLVSKISHVDFTMFFPSFRIITKYTMPSFCFWIIIFLGLNIYMLTKEKINLHRH